MARGSSLSVSGTALRSAVAASSGGAWPEPARRSARRWERDRADSEGGAGTSASQYGQIFQRGSSGFLQGRQGSGSLPVQERHRRNDGSTAAPQLRQGRLS